MGVGEDGSLLLLIRVPGQRWHRMVCFGRVGHYRKDGSCAHTDAVYEQLTPYGRRVTKLRPWGDGQCMPKRVRERMGVAA